MKIKEKLLDKINEKIEEIENKLKDLTEMLKFHETGIRDLANDIAIYQTYHNISSMYNHLTTIRNIEGEINILDEEICFLRDLKKDIDNEEEL